MNNPERIGRITSSKIHLLVKTGRGKDDEFSRPALTYFEELNIERKLGKCLDVGASTRAMAWGKFMELVIFNLLGMEYKISSETTELHPDKEFSKDWAGSYDLIVPKKRVAEIKCYQLKKFAQYTDCILQKDVALLREKFPQEYWQIVSNAIINNVPQGEVITYAPYESEMAEIRSLAENYDGEKPWDYRFIYEESLDNLAVLKDGGYYQNLNSFCFDISKEDIEFITERVRLAQNYLFNF